ncbi:MAG: manganese efflux pump MntP family protein [Phycisphaerae bacterium]|nr:manganese efflux pump MntP family protein [Phycisphaerae bacterium]
MKLLTILLIAVGLAMDAFAVSVVTGSVYKEFKVRHALRMALFFGGFQAVMPIIGFLAGLSLKDYIEAYDHWIALALLSFVGGKMIYESFKIDAVERNRDPSNPLVLLALSFATSIDALAVGITLSLLKTPILLAVTIIGLVTFGLSYTGVAIGKRFGHFFESKVEIVGGIILIAIGIKIVVEHLTA